MASIVRQEDREELERLDERIEELLQGVGEQAHAIDPAFVGSWVETLRGYALRLSDTPPRALGTEAVSEIRKIVLQGITAQEELSGRPLDQLDDAMVRAEAVVVADERLGGKARCLCALEGAVVDDRLRGCLGDPDLHPDLRQLLLVSETLPAGKLRPGAAWMQTQVLRRPVLRERPPARA